MEPAFANVIIDISHEKVDRPFCYAVPEELQGLVAPGSCVEVPFGKGSRLRKGFVIELCAAPGYLPEKIRPIAGLVEGIQVESRLIRLAAWMKHQYGATMITALQTVLPVKKRVAAREKKIICRKTSEEAVREALALCRRKRYAARARLLEALLADDCLPYELVTGKLHVAAASLRSLQEQGLITVEEVRRQTDRPAEATYEKRCPTLVLSEQQRHIVEEIGREYASGITGTYLIHGITGSGKTEVYLALMEKVVSSGRAVIFLIPEIALTFQTVMRCRRRFGQRVSFLHSGLSMGERYEQCERAKRGEIDVIIGPRSALFTPFRDLGMILIDEEHESAYKSESMPKYHAVEAARELARLHGASLVLGSATPSLESYHRAVTGRDRLFTLTKRLTGGSLPYVYIEDLRKELRNGNRSMFSDRLRGLIVDRLEKREQILLFLNRRGYSGFVSCRSCGLVLKCPHCDVSLSQHGRERMACHYCGYGMAKPTLCPACRSRYLMGFKAGTEKIEEQFLREFGPRFGDIPILRMDGDTTKTKHSHEKILSEFAEEKARVLIGTQMIVKGHDFPNVTLVGILAADLSLAVNDYRAAERTFQLLTQAAGRAGRGSRPGEVVIQSYQPEHYSIRRAAAQDYPAFYREEMIYRSMAGYPPVAHMLVVQVFDREERRGKELAVRIRERIAAAAMARGVTVIGPASGQIGRINDVFRFSLTLKHEKKEALIACKDEIEGWLATCAGREKAVQFDFDPMHTF